MPIPHETWLMIEAHLGITEGEPEPIVHELAHAYDCIQEEAFDYLGVGNQAQVVALIRETYSGEALSVTRYGDLAANWSEIRASAITYLVLQRLGHGEDRCCGRDGIVTNMWSNLPQSWRTKANRNFDFLLKSKRVREAAEAICTFLTTFAEEAAMDKARIEACEAASNAYDPRYEVIESG